MDAFSLIAKISLDSSEYDSGLSSAGSKLSSFGTAIKTGLGTAAKVGTAAVAAIGTAVVGGSAAFIKGAGDIAQYGDNIDKMSQKMGISAQGYQEWEAVMQHSGTSMETLKAGMKTLANAVEKDNDAFKRLGISQEQIASMNNEELFNTTISALQNVENETERTYLAGQLLGRGATELGALLNTSAEDTQAMKDRVHELGGVMSDEAVKAAAHYQDTLQDMQTSFSGLKMSLMSEFLPSITMVMEGLTDLFSGNGGLDKIKQGITDFTDKFAEAMPQVLEVGAEIINSLMAAIMDNLPQLVDAGASAVSTLASGLVENAGIIGDSLLELMGSAAEHLSTFDWAGSATQIANGLTNAFSGEGASQFISTASSILSGIVSGIGESLPILIPAAVEIVSQLASDLAEQVPMLMEAAAVLITGLIDGIYNADAINTFTEAGIQLALALGDGLGTQGPVIIGKLVQGIVSNYPQLFLLGPTLIVAFITGIVGALGQLAEPAIQMIVELVNQITAQFSKILTAGQQLLMKFIEGIKAKFGELKNTATQIIETVKNAITEKIKQAKQWGSDLMNNFIEGIKEKIAALKDMVGSVAGTVKSVLGHSHPEEGPMADDYTWMPDMMKMFAEGIRDNTDLVTDQLKKSFDIGDIVTSPFANATTNTNPNTEIINLLTQIRDKGNVIVIEGDAARMFRVMQSESRKYHQTTGREAFA